MAKDGFQTIHWVEADTPGAYQDNEGQWYKYDADPLINGVQYRSIPGDPESVAQLKSKGLDVQEHPEYGWIAPDDAKYAAAFPDRATDSIFDLGPIIIASLFTAGMANGFIGGGAGAAAGEVAAGAAGASAASGLSEAAIAEIVAAEGGYSALASSGMAGTADTAGSGILGNIASGAARGAATSALTGGDPVQGALTGGVTGGLSDVFSTISDTVSEWFAPFTGANYADHAMEMASTVESAATGAGDITSVAKDVLPSDTQSAARRLVQSAEDVTGAEAGSGAWKATSGAGTETSIWDKIWNGVTSDKGMAAAITVGGSVIGGMSTAAYNRETMQDKAALDLQNAQALQAAKTDQSRQNMFKGIIGVRPAATRAPLQRLSGGPVYDSRGLIRRA